MRIPLLSAALAAAAGIGARLFSRPAPRGSFANWIPSGSIFDAPALPVADTVPSRGWWTEPQSEASIVASLRAARERRERRADGPNPSAYAAANDPRLC